MGIVIGQTKDDITGMILGIYWKCQHFCKKKKILHMQSLIKRPNGTEPILPGNICKFEN